LLYHILKLGRTQKITRIQGSIRHFGVLPSVIIWPIQAA
jgi:hypothetical protein